MEVPLYELEPEAAHWNLTNHINNIKMDSNFAWLLCSLVSAMAWVIYITYYNARVMGFFITRLLNKLFIHTGYMQVGSITCNVLSGKIMFRNIAYVTHDYTIRIQDGWLIFRWWRSYVPKDVSEDLSHSDTRLSVQLNGFELHVYNRCKLYSKLEQDFFLESQMFPCMDETNKDGKEKSENKITDDALGVVTISGTQGAASLSHSWRDLIPVIKMDISSGRVVFGNRLVPTTLSINVEEAHFVYSTKPAASRLDHFMHFIKCKSENFKVILAPSPKYIGMVDDPPRYMGEGFVVLSSNNMELYYYMDETGLVPEEPEMLQLANGDIVESAPPIWGMDIKCGKGTDFSYGPWADRQREHLFKFFFPNDYGSLKVTKAPQRGEKRQVQSFDIRLSTLSEATVDLLFSKNKETNAVHINVGPGSYLEVTMPWVVLADGYTTKVTGQLLHLEATTSLQYRSLVESETLEFTIKCHYPIRWNDHQEWLLTLTGCKATVNLIYAHKWFFQDLINDWANKSCPDLLYFVPYTWKINLLLKEFELITLCNEYNWIDCSSQNQENSHIAFCGELFDLSFDLSFNNFLPTTIPLRFWIQGESVDLTFYLPEVCSSHSILLALDSNAKILCRDGVVKHKQNGPRKWRNVCHRRNGWVDCWAVPIVALCINYIYHPIPPLGPSPQADITTPEKEEILLSPMRIPRCRKPACINWSQDGSQKLDPTSLSPDQVSLDLEIGPSVLLLYGSLLRSFLHLKRDLVDLRAELSEACRQNLIGKKDRDTVLPQCYGNEHVPDVNMEYDAQHIQHHLQFESQQSSSRLPNEGKDVNFVEESSLQNEVTLLRREVNFLRNSLTSLYSALYGAEFTAIFFDEDLGGRCSSGDNNADHIKLDNIEGQTSVTSQQTVDKLSIESSLGSKSMDVTNYGNFKRSDNIATSDLLALEIIKARRLIKNFDNVYDSKNVYAFPEQYSSSNLEPSSVPPSESSDNPPPLSIHRPLVKPGPGKSKYLKPLRFSRV